MITDAEIDRIAESQEMHDLTGLLAKAGLRWLRGELEALKLYGDPLPPDATILLQKLRAVHPKLHATLVQAYPPGQPPREIPKRCFKLSLTEEDFKTEFPYSNLQRKSDGLPTA